MERTLFQTVFIVQMLTPLWLSKSNFMIVFPIIRKNIIMCITLRMIKSFFLNKIDLHKDEVAAKSKALLLNIKKY